MAAMVMMERHLWLNLSGIKECDKAGFLDAPVLPSGLFGAAVEMVVNRFKEARMQSAAFEKFISLLLNCLEPLPGTSSCREERKASVANRALFQGVKSQGVIIGGRRTKIVSNFNL